MAISSAVDASAIARVVGIETIFKDLRGGSITFLPQRIAVVGQGATASTYATTKLQLSDALTVAQTYGFGSPLHLAAKQLFPVNGDGVGSIPVTFYPLEDAAGSAAAAGDITPAGSATSAGSFRVLVNNIRSEAFLVNTGDSVAVMVTAMAAAIAATLDLPVLASDDTTDVGITAKWQGQTGAGIILAIEGPTDIGVTFAFTQLTGGAANPDVQDALDQVGDVWETLFLSCMDIAHTSSLDTFSAFGEGRWGALVKKPCMVFTGNTATTVAAATAVSDARKSDRTNSQLVAPGSDDLPFVTAARQLARIAVVANNNPPRDYGSQDATGLTAGVDGDQWTYPERDQAVKAGSSTVEVKSGVVNLSDTVTFYHPDGDPIPAYRYVCDIVKLQNIIFNQDLIFSTDAWDGAPLIPDDQPTSNRSAKKPKTAVAAVAAMIDSLALEAIISDPETAKATIVAGINGANPKRLDIAWTAQVSGNANIISIDFNWGFYFGTAPVVA
jgi:phage tail sheath gpL-like